nr:MAG: hypothetical protein DIU78_19740 [Pseudomonadota bacterium]
MTADRTMHHPRDGEPNAGVSRKDGSRRLAGALENAPDAAATLTRLRHCGMRSLAQPLRLVCGFADGSREPARAPETAAHASAPTARLRYCRMRSFASASGFVFARAPGLTKARSTPPSAPIPA